MKIQSFECLKKAKNILVLAVGGGNDSVSTLLLQQQLHVEHGYCPENIHIVAVLPDCLDYHDLLPSPHPLVGIIQPTTTRSVQGKEMKAFPERILSTYKNELSLPLSIIYGISMREGSKGVARGLQYLLDTGNYDMVLAIDVGGDFIAHQNNIEVLSPMMDGYMLSALRIINTSVPFIYCVFGLGTDGESTVLMLNEALSLIDYYEGRFDAQALEPFIHFYRQKVEPNRYSRTADFTIREIQGVEHDNPALFRGRFHIKGEHEGKPYYGEFLHFQDPHFFGKYYLFDDISHVHNRYSIACENGIEWFCTVQEKNTKINHELNGQAYMDIGAILRVGALSNKSLFFGTPSHKFNETQQVQISQDVFQAIKKGTYDLALVYSDYLNKPIFSEIITPSLAVIGQDKNLVQEFIKAIRKV